MNCGLTWTVFFMEFPPLQATDTQCWWQVLCKETVKESKKLAGYVSISGQITMSVSLYATWSFLSKMPISHLPLQATQPVQEMGWFLFRTWYICCNVDMVVSKPILLKLAHIITSITHNLQIRHKVHVQFSLQLQNKNHKCNIQQYTRLLPALVQIDYAW